MKYCVKCVMPDTRPGIALNGEGVCSACQSYERRKNINWNERWKQFEKICDKYRGMNGNGYDCAIAVSGGKDSHYPGIPYERSYENEPHSVQCGR